MDFTRDVHVLGKDSPTVLKFKGILKSDRDAQSWMGIYNPNTFDGIPYLMAANALQARSYNETDMVVVGQLWTNFTQREVTLSDNGRNVLSGIDGESLFSQSTMNAIGMDDNYQVNRINQGKKNLSSYLTRLII